MLCIHFFNNKTRVGGCDGLWVFRSHDGVGFIPWGFNLAMVFTSFPDWILRRKAFKETCKNLNDSVRGAWSQLVTGYFSPPPSYRFQLYFHRAPDYKNKCQAKAGGPL